MANDESVLREVDQELAEDQQWAMFRKYGPAAIGAGAALVVAVGGWQFWNAHKNSVAKEQALEFRNAVDLLAEDADQGRVALGAISEEGASGYGFLAELQRAASYARDGDRASAIGVYRDIYDNGGAPKRLRDLARIRAAYLALNDGRDAVMAHLGDLPNEEGAFSYHAAEVSGLAALEARDYETSLSIFRGLSIDISAPQAVRTRAEDFAALADSGKAGVNITGETRVDDLLEAIGAGDDAGEIEEGAAAASADNGVALQGDDSVVDVDLISPSDIAPDVASDVDPEEETENE